MATLQIIWFILIGVLLAGYAVLDGFDLGAGALYPVVARTAEEKALVRDSIGPVWDGNEVWLLTGGGALFAAFPPVYATVFSGFYLAMMLVLFALIFRAISFEFRANDPAWGGLWDWAFTLGSLLPALLFGVAAGNIALGVKLTPAGVYAGTFFDLLNPFALLCGITGLVYFVQHGASWLVLKTYGPVRDRALPVRHFGQYAYAALLAVLTITTLLLVPARFMAALGNPFGWLGILLTWGGIVAAIVLTARGVDLWSFVASGASIVGLVALWAVGIFPYLVPALGSPGGLSVYNASSSQLTLTVMLIIAAIGVPIVLAYTALIYKVFAGKTVPHQGY